MSISVIGASSRQMRQMRNKTELQQSNLQDKCAECMLKEQKDSVEIVDEHLGKKKNELSIASLHRKVEAELKEKQKKIALLRQGIIQSPNQPRRHTCKPPKKEESRCTSWSSWSKSHPAIVMCILCILVISIVIVIIVFIYMIKK